MCEYKSESDFERRSRKRERVKFDHMMKKRIRNWEDIMRLYLPIYFRSNRKRKKK